MDYFPKFMNLQLMNLMSLTSPSPNNALALLVYVLMLAIAIVVARRYKHSAMKRMERTRETIPELDLYDLAFLSGGAQRMLQLAAFRLHTWGLFTYKKGILRKYFIPVRLTGSVLEGSTLLERYLHTHSLALGRVTTLSDPNFRSAAKPLIERVETQLAIAGYRPTMQERGTIQGRIFLIFMIPLVVGGLRVIYGITHGYPVWYLVTLMVLTVIIGGIMSTSVGKLTARGSELLRIRRCQTHVGRSRSNADSRHELACLTLALEGPIGLAYFAEFSHLQQGVQSVTPGNSAGDGGSSGCGTSSCGSSGSSGCGSGCGGGGCGGGGD